MRFLTTLALILLRPRRGFARVRDGEAPGSAGFMAVLLLGAIWAVWLVILALGGHAPSGPIVLPVPREDYYWASAAFVIPLQLLMLLGASLVLHGLARLAGGDADLCQSCSVVALAVSVPFACGLLLPEMAVYAVAGFEALAHWVKWVAPVSFAWSVGWMTLGLRTVHRVPPLRAWCVAFSGVVVYLALGAPLLR